MLFVRPSDMAVRTITPDEMRAAKRFPFDHESCPAMISEMDKPIFKLELADLELVRRLRFPGRDPRTVADTQTVRNAHSATEELEREIERLDTSSQLLRGTVWKRRKDHPSIYVCFLYERMALQGLSEQKRKLLRDLTQTQNSFAAYVVFENAKAATSAEAGVWLNDGTMRELLPVADEQPLYVMKHGGQAKLEHREQESPVDLDPPALGPPQPAAAALVEVEPSRPADLAPPLGVGSSQTAEGESGSGSSSSTSEGGGMIRKYPHGTAKPYDKRESPTKSDQEVKDGKKACPEDNVNDCIRNLFGDTTLVYKDMTTSPSPSEHSSAGSASTPKSPISEDACSTPKKPSEKAQLIEGIEALTPSGLLEGLEALTPSGLEAELQKE